MQYFYQKNVQPDSKHEETIRQNQTKIHSQNAQSTLFKTCISKEWKWGVGVDFARLKETKEKGKSNLMLHDS